MAHLGVLLLFCVLTTMMLYPLARHPFELTLGGETDNLYFVRQFWWMKHTLADLHTSPFFDGSSYSPIGQATSDTEMSPAATIPALPLTMTGGPVFAYNVTVLFTFVWTGFATYLWIDRLTGSRAGAIVAGIVGAFLPFRFAHADGHLPIISTQWVAWAFYAFERFLARKSVARAATLGLSIALTALSAWYYAYAIALLLPVYAVLRSYPWREQWDRQWWRGVAMAAVTAALLTLPFLIPYLRLRSATGLTRSFDEMESWSINFYDFFLPNRLNPAWAGFVLRWFPEEGRLWGEFGVALGFTALGLAAVACTARRRHQAITALLVVWIASFAIALGPTLHAGDRQIVIPVPRPAAVLAVRMTLPFASLAAVRRAIVERQAVPVPMPAMFLFLFVPLTDGMRVMARFGMWTGLMTAGLAGWGTALLIESMRTRTSHRRFAPVAVVVIAGSLVLAESYSEVGTIELRPREVDVWLSQQPRGAVIELPIEQALRPLQNYYKTVHEQPTAFGPIGASFVSPILEPRKAALVGFPSSTSVAALRAWGVRYVLFTPAVVPDWPAFRRKLDATPDLQFARDVGGVMVYFLSDAAADRRPDYAPTR